MKTILALDDDPVVMLFVKKVLDGKGYRTFTATTCEEFYRLFREQKVDLVLLDICMPVKNGLDVFKELCGDTHPPVLFVTGDVRAFSVESKTAMELWQNAFSDGTVDIIYKPFTIAGLHQKVVSLIGEAEELQ